VVGNAQVFVVLTNNHPVGTGVLAGHLLQDGVGVVCGAVIRQDDFQWLAHLSKARLGRLGHKVLLVVGKKEDCGDHCCRSFRYWRIA
jgi:hypothetical protein